MMGENGQQFSVPPGFRFHPTDEELLYYYLRKKVSYESIELDVITEVDLNKLEPWDLKEKCRIGSGHQNEWYFFSHKDKKYPTGTRTNRATSAGFWKATGRDKSIHMANSKRIGMRKTLVFYTGRAPHGQKTDWIMHEYRLEDDDSEPQQLQEEGWVVCRVFKKKTQKTEIWQEQLQHYPQTNTNQGSSSTKIIDPKNNSSNNPQDLQPYNNNNNDYMSSDGCMQLPQLFSPESLQVAPTGPPGPQTQTMWRPSGGPVVHQQDHHRPNGPADWSFLNRLLASSSSEQHATFLDHFPATMGLPKFSFPLPCPYPYPHFTPPTDFVKFSK